MDDKDSFAVWMAGAVLRANNDEIAAEALGDLARQAQTSAELDAALNSTRSVGRRPGDFGVEFIGPLLPILLIEFGRMLWDAYAKSLADQGGKALATATLNMIKVLARRTWTQTPGAISPGEAEQRLREAALHCGLDSAQTEKLVSSLRSPELAHELASK
jgi:hypothetical protein